MKRVQLEQLLKAVDGTAVGFPNQDIEFESIGTDSRSIQPKQLFWALQGDNHDGHDYVRDANKRGAVASVVAAKNAGKSKGPRVEVEDTLVALLDFTHWYRREFEALVVGITGSVGKTTTRRMVHAILSTKFSGVQSPKNFNNQFGIPFSVLQLDSHHEFAVFELAATRPGEIRELADVIAPEVGIVTSIAAAHLNGFGTMERVAEAKGELIESLPESGFAVINGDDANCRKLGKLAKCPTFFVGEAAGNDLRATDVAIDVDRVSFTADGERYCVPATGRHHLTAALLGIVVAREFGLDADEIHEGLSRFQPAAGRCQQKHVGNITLIDDTYNSNPRSVQAACDLLEDWPVATRRLLVLGDMLELGKVAADLHFNTGQYIGEADLDGLIAVGRFADDLVAGAIESGMASKRIATCQDHAVLTAVLDCWLQAGDVVLVKGSRSTHMESVVHWIEGRVSSSSSLRRAA
jgi:UDP-N-acetylmuramoyl-tripeptide--D-alanyl-D-alanine ligase